MKIWMYIAVLISLIGCSKEEPEIYGQDTDCIYFDYGAGGSEATYNFAAQKRTNEQGREYYPGDTLQIDTLKINIAILGHSSPERRPVFFKLIPVKGQDSSRLAKIEVIDSCFIEADKYKTSTKVLIHRPQERQYDYTIGLTFDEEKTGLDRGPYEQQVYKIVLRDYFTKPADWDSFFNQFLGEWTPEKFAFVTDYFQSLTLPGSGSMMMWQRMHTPNLKAALQAYNDAHPDNKKPFTFPD